MWELASLPSMVLVVILVVVYCASLCCPKLDSLTLQLQFDSYSISICILHSGRRIFEFAYSYCYYIYYCYWYSYILILSISCAIWLRYIYIYIYIHTNLSARDEDNYQALPTKAPTYTGMESQSGGNIHQGSGGERVDLNGWFLFVQCHSVPVRSVSEW